MILLLSLRTAAAPPPAKALDFQPVKPVNGAISAVAFSPNGRLLAVGGYRQVWLLDVPPAAGRDGRAAPISSLIPHPSSLLGASGPVTSVAFSPNGRWLAAAGGAPGQFGEIQLWDLNAHRRVRTLRGHRDAIYGVSFSPDGRTLAAGSYDRLVSLWPVAGGSPRMLKDHIDAVYAVAFSPDGHRVASAAGDRTIKVWDTATGRRVYTLSEPTAEQYTVAFSRDGRRLAAGGADKILRVWDVTSTGGKLVHSAFAHGGAILRVVFSPDGRSLYTTGEDRRVKIWDVATLTERRVLERQPDWALALALDPRGERIAVGRFDGSVALYNAADGRRMMPLLPLSWSASEPHVTRFKMARTRVKEHGRG